MKKDKKIKYIDYISKAIFVLCIISVCIIEIVKPRENTIRGEGFEIGKNRNDSETAFLILQKYGERENEIKTVKSLLNQNDIEYYLIKFRNENGVINASETVKKELSGKKVIMLSHYKDYGKYFDELNLKGKILCSPLETDDRNLPILLISTATDKKCTTENITKLYNELTDSKINSTGFGVNAEKDNVSMKIIAKAVGSLSGLSEPYINSMNMWLDEKFSLELHYKNYGFIKLIILAATVISLCTSYIIFRPKENSQDNTVYRLVSIKAKGIYKYFLVRVLIFISGILICGILTGMIAIIPFLNFNTANIFCAYIFSAGIVNFILFKSGKMPGIVGKISSKDIIASNSKQSIKTLLIMATCLIPMIMSVVLGIGEMKISFENIPQYVFCFVATFMGYYSYNLENMVLSQTEQCRTVKIMVGISPFLPMLIIAVAGIPFGNPTWIYTGIIDIIGIFVITMAGSAAEKINNHIVFTSFMESLICTVFLNLIRFA